MKLLTLHYTNIGPFQDKTITINPQAGSYLIKAPIGSGKSILFFDGPMFALYKKSHRPLLNMNSQKGTIIVEFEHEGICYCIRRQLTKTKTGESVKSTLWTNTILATHRPSEELLRISEPEEFVFSPSYTLIEFKNESDLQKTLDELLPRKEVMQATYFLMQESQNIFELPPQERLTIFKNIFDLLGIDQSKEKIAEYKRETNAIIKARSDIEQYDTKLQHTLQPLLTQWSTLKSVWDRYHYNIEQEWLQFIDEQQLLRDKVMIDNFSLPAIPDTETVKTAIAELQDRYHTQKIQTELAQQALQTQETHIKTLKEQHEQIKRQINRLELQSQQYDAYRLNTLQKDLQTLQNKQEQLWTKQESQGVQHHLAKLALHNKDDQLPLPDGPLSLAQGHHLIQHYITKGKEYKYQQQAFLDQQDTLSQQRTQLDTQIQELQASIRDFSAIAKEQSTFHCRKIESSCPYVDLINTSVAKKNKEQLDRLEQQLSHLHTQQKDLSDRFERIASDPTPAQRAKDLATLTDLIIHVDWKGMEQRTQERNDLDQQLKSKQQELMRIQQQQQAFVQSQEELIGLKHQHFTLQEQLTLQEPLLQDKQEEYHIQRNLLTTLIPTQDLQNDLNTLQIFEQQYSKIRELLDDYSHNILEVKKLKHKEKILGELYAIFSKELLLMVIQSNLPKIQDLMNAYLAQTVDYQLSMEIDKKSARTDNLELFVHISDQHGTRKVESLSGGQKVILKLVWMIAISFVTNAPMLFLDETINNLDADTVAKVADMIKNFVKTKGTDFQFFVISHSQQIQEMDIWDATVFVPGSSNSE